MDERAKICRVFVNIDVFEAATQDGDARIGVTDVGRLGAVGGEAGGVVRGGGEDAQHATHATAGVEDRRVGLLNQVQQQLGVPALGAVQRIEADRLGRRVRVVEVAVVEEIAGQHAVVQRQLGVGMHGWDAAVHPSATEPAEHVLRQERTSEDLLQDPAAVAATFAHATAPPLARPRRLGSATPSSRPSSSQRTAWIEPMFASRGLTGNSA